MTTQTSTEIIRQLHEINSRQIHSDEKQSQYRAFVLDQHHGDVCEFILGLAGIPLDHITKIVSLLEDLHLDAASFTLSSRLPEALALFASYGADKTLSTKVLSWLKAVNNESVMASLPKANILAMGEYSLKHIPSEDVGLADTASQLFGNLMKHHYAELGPLYSFGRQFSDNSSVFLRFLSIYSKVSACSDDHFKGVYSTGAISDIQQICKSNDILLQINAIELLLDIANTQCGLQYLCENGAVQWLIDTSCGTAAAPSVDPLLCGETLRVLGGVFAKASERSFDFVGHVDATSVHRFLDTLIGYFEERDEANRIKGVVILSDFATISHTAFSMVLAHANGRLLSEWLDLLNAGKPELIGAVLHSLARIVNQEESRYVANDTHTLTAFKNIAQRSDDAANVSVPQVDERVVTEMKKRLMGGITQAKGGVFYVTFLLKTARLPVPSVRHAALDLLAAIASQPSGWGLLAITQAPVDSSGDFMSYITNRETEFSKEGKDWKYSLIKAIALNPSRSHLNDEFNAKIDHMVNQGPYFMPHRMADMQTI